MGLRTFSWVQVNKMKYFNVKFVFKYLVISDYDTTMSQYLPRWLPPYLPYTPWWHSPMTMIPPCPSTSGDGYPLTISTSHGGSLPWLWYHHVPVPPEMVTPLHLCTPWWHSPMTMIPPCPSTSGDGYPLTIPTPHGGILPWLWYHHVPVPMEMVTPLTYLHPMVAFSNYYDTTMSQYLRRWLPPYHLYTSWWHSPMTMIPPCPSTYGDGYHLTISTPHGGILPWLWYHHVPVPPEMVTPLPYLHPMVAFSNDYHTTMSQYLWRWLPPYHLYTPWWHSPMIMIPPCPSTSGDGYPLTISTPHGGILPWLWYHHVPVPMEMVTTLPSLHPMVAFSHDYDTTMFQYLRRWLPPYHIYTPWWHSPMTIIPPCPSTSGDGYPLTISTLHGGILPWLWYHHVPVPPEMVTPLPSLHPMVAFSYDYDTTISQYLLGWLPPYHPYTPWWHSPMTMIPPCPSTSGDSYPLTIPTPHGGILPWLWYPKKATGSIFSQTEIPS